MAHIQPVVVPAEEAPTVPPAFGPYLVEGALASGGMGVLYRARHRDSGRAVAIKTVVPDKESVVGGMRSEIRALARLIHPSVARILDEGVHSGHPWYAMELVEGKTLARFRDDLWHGHTTADLSTDIGTPVNATGRTMATSFPAIDALPQFGARQAAAAGRLSEVLTVVQRLCGALAHIHGRGIVHRDLKPENVLVRPDGTPVLIDFGVAGHFPAALAREILEPSSTLSGTVAYMAPEQFRRGTVDARADLYSLGSVLYELISGRRPYIGAAHLGDAHMSDAPPVPSAVVDGVPPALDALVVRLLAKHPRDRLGYATDVAEALQEILSQLQRPSTAASAPRPSDDTKRDTNPDATAEPKGGDGFYLYRPEMVGRQEPRDLIFKAIEGALGGHGGVFFLGGESGIGKTMLAGELSKQAAALGLRVVTGECTSATGDLPQPGSRSPLAPFRRFLQTVADHCRARGPTVTRELFGGQASLLARVEPALADLPGVTPRPPESDLTGEAARSAVLTAVAELIFAFCKQQPLLLVLDDVQWADELSLAVLKLLPPERLADLPLVMLATFRTDEVPDELRDLIEKGGAHVVRLERLDEGGVAAMVTEMLGMGQPPAAMVRFLARTSEGNPFFVAEYMRAAVSDGVLLRNQGQWQFARGAPGHDTTYESLSLPNSLRGLIRRRMVGFSPAVTRLLDVAAVIGRVVDPTLLGMISGQDHTSVLDGLNELRARQVLEERGGQLRFVHDKLRAHAYDSLDEPARQDLHLKVALALESEGARDPHSLAFHFHAGGRPDRALPFAIRAGEQSFAAGALHEAHDHLSRALALENQRDPTLPPRPKLERARLRRILGEARAGIGDLDGSEAVLREAYDLCGVGSMPRGSLGWGLFLLGQLAVQFLHWLLPARWRRRSEGVAALEEAALIANRVGFAFMINGHNLGMLGVLTRAANLAERADVPAPRGIPYSILAGAFGVMRARGLSQRYFAASRRVVSESRDLVAPLQQAQIEGFYYLNFADWNAARAVLEPAFTQGKALGIPYEMEALGIARAWLEIMTGQSQRALALLGQVRSTAESLGNRLHEWWARRYQAFAYLQEGRPQDALDVVAPAEAGFRERGGVIDLINILAVRAIAHQRLGERDLALTCARESFDLAMSHPGVLSHCFEFHAFAPEVFLRAFADARVHAKAKAASLARAAKLCLKASSRYASMFPIGRPSLLSNRARLSHIVGDDRKSRVFQEKAASVAAALGMPLDPVL